MSPLTNDITVPSEDRWQAGDLVSFTLHFEYSDPIQAVAEVIRPGSR
jgi:hypothetical protein